MHKNSKAKAVLTLISSAALLCLLSGCTKQQAILGGLAFGAAGGAIAGAAVAGSTATTLTTAEAVGVGMVAGGVGGAAVGSLAADEDDD